MKLHLPVGLRVALLAVLASLSIAFGKVTVKQKITDENPAGETYTFEEENVVTGNLEGKVEIKIEKSSDDDAETQCTLSKEGGYVYVAQNSTSSFEVAKDCTLTMEGVYVGYADKASTSTTINVEGGAVIAGVKNDGQKEALIGCAYAKGITTTTTINISDNGSFQFAENGRSGIGTVYGKGSVSNNTINITSGTFTAGESIGAVNGSNGDGHSINKFIVDGANSSLILDSCNIGRVADGASSSKTTIEVINGGTVTTQGTTSYIGNSGTYKTDVETTIDIKVDASSFAFQGSMGNMGHEGSSSTTSITLTNGSIFTYTPAGSSVGAIGAITESGASATVVIDITDSDFKMEGASSLSSCDDIGCVNASRTGVGYDGTATTILRINGTEEGKGKFEMLTDSARLSCNKRTQGTAGTTNLRVELHGYGSMTVSKGSIGGSEATIDLYDNSTLTLTTDSSNISENLVVILHGGKLGESFTGNKVAIDTAEEFTGTIDLGGLDASKITQEFTRKVQDADTGEYTYEPAKGFRIGGADTHITGLKAGTTLTLSGANGVDGYDNSIMVGSSSAWLKTSDDASSTPSGKEALIGFKDGNGTVDFGKGSKFFLNLVDYDLVKELLQVQEPCEVSFQVYFTNGELSFSSEDLSDHFTLGAGWGLQVKGYEMTEDGGVLTITGKTNIGLLSGSEDDPTLEELSENEAVIVTGDATLESTEEGGTLRHLTGEGNLTIEGSGKVELENNLDEFGYGDSELTGNITTTGDVDLHKTGSEDLTLSGDLKAQKNLTVDEGGLAIEQRQDENGNTVGGNLTVGGALTVGGSETSGTLDVQGNLNAQDVTVQNGELTLTGDDNVIGGQLTLGEKGTLEVDGQLTLSGSVNEESTGTLTGNGTVILDGDIQFGDVTLGGDLTIQMGEHCKEAYFGDNEVTLDDLTGSGSITGENLTVSNGEGEVFSGTLNGSATVEEGHSFHVQGLQGSCNFTMKDRSTLDLTQGGNSLGDVKSTPSKEGVEGSGATYKLQTDAKANTVNGDFVIRTEDTTIINLDLNQDAMWGTGECNSPMLTTTDGGRIIIEEGTTFKIHNLKDIVAEHSGSGLKNIVIMTGNIDTTTAYESWQFNPADGNLKAKVELDGILKALFKSAHIEFKDAEGETGEPVAAAYSLFGMSAEDAIPEPVNKNGILVFDPYTNSDIEDSSRSSVAYAGGMLLNQYVSKNLFNSDPAVLNVMEAIGNATDAGEGNRIRAAVAGSTLTSVSAAQSAALRNQMGRVRDHALQAGRLRCMGNDEATAQQRPCRNSHVWVEGTSFFSEQHSVGDESGYRLNSWGGALGIDAQVDAHWSVGVSLSASYGDLEARAADYAKGDLDTYTVSFWSQAKNGRWGNTLLFTLGTNEADLKRTVNYGAGSYTATSNTSGSSLGAMWELTYDFHPVKDNKSNILQPLFNVALTRTSMDGFSEKNAGNVGLTTEKQTRDTVTLGLGLRWLAAINSAKAVNRTVSTEVHANVAQDMGDRRSVANVALLADPSYTQNVYGSKAGSTAFQFGAGVNVPMTPNSQIYVNAGGELREHANAWNAALGVRMGF